MILKYGFSTVHEIDEIEQGDIMMRIDVNGHLLQNFDSKQTMQRMFITG